MWNRPSAWGFNGYKCTPGETSNKELNFNNSEYALRPYIQSTCKRL